MRLQTDLRHALICPSCRRPVCHDGRDRLRCESGHAFPLIDGVPILIDDTTSLFRVSDFAARQETTFRSGGRLRRLKRYMPRLVARAASSPHEDGFADLLLARCAHARILVIGAGEDEGRAADLRRHSDIVTVMSDVHIGSLTDLVSDAHSIPFADKTFDGVMLHAVMEHLIEPWTAAEEIRRVLKPGGLVWSTWPFVQQVHMGAHDFYRASPLAHRLIWAQFDTIHHAPKGGVGTPLAWAWYYALRGFARGQAGKHAAEALARVTAWPLHAVDRLTTGAPGAWDGARSSTFIGRKRADDAPCLDRRELLKIYGGLG